MLHLAPIHNVYIPSLLPVFLPSLSDPFFCILQQYVQSSLLDRILIHHITSLLHTGSQSICKNFTPILRIKILTSFISPSMYINNEMATGHSSFLPLYTSLTSPFSLTHSKRLTYILFHLKAYHQHHTFLVFAIELPFEPCHPHFPHSQNLHALSPSFLNQLFKNKDFFTHPPPAYPQTIPHSLCKYFPPTLIKLIGFLGLVLSPLSYAFL